MKKSILILVAALTFFLIVRYFYFLPTLIFGDSAPVFQEKSINGNVITIENFKGNYLLLNFWGSWCLPCRQENKIISMFYNRYKSDQFKNASGIKFLSVALENNKVDAEKAIIQDGLIWPDQIIQTNLLSSSLAIQYGIKQIPFMYLIGPDQRIILANPDIKELDDYLAHNLLKN